MFKHPFDRTSFEHAVRGVTFAASSANKKPFSLMGLVYANIELLNATDVDMAARHQIGEDEIRGDLRFQSIKTAE